MKLKSAEITTLSYKEFHKIENHRFVIVNEIAKVIDIDRGLIELLLPIQTDQGADLKFYIRSERSQDKQLLGLLQKSVDNEYLANVCYTYNT